MKVFHRTINIHRANFQKLLLDEATEAGTVVHTDARVVKIDDSGDYPIAYTKDGREWKADLIIGADGTHPQCLSLPI
jgi:salicylate hydroxylase